MERVYVRKYTGLLIQNMSISSQNMEICIASPSAQMGTQLECVHHKKHEIEGQREMVRFKDKNGNGYKPAYPNLEVD